MKNVVTYNEKELRRSMTPRIEAMRKEIVHSKPILCSERALLVTEAYAETEALPSVTRRAFALKKILGNMTQNIFEGELIVGSHGSNGRRSAPVFPEFSTKWLEEELDEILETRTQDTFIVPKNVKEDLKDIFPYWRGKTIHDRYRAMLPDETKRARDAYMFTRGLFEQNGYGHTAYDIPKLLKVGLVGIKSEVNEKMQTLDLTTSEGLEKKLFYEGLIVCCDSVIAYAKRYAQRALELADQEKNPVRKKELEKIADVCQWVPENPARDTWDAIQVVAFMQLIIQTETNGDSVCPGRLDQYLYSYYKNDMAEGRYTIDEIQELLDCLWIKLNEIIKIQASESVRIHPGFPMTPTVTIGGQTPEGEDATNELSYLMLNSQEHIRLTNPQFTVRFHKDTPEDFKLRVVEVVKLGTGMPAMFGDEACIAALKRGCPDMPMERIRDYRIVGCVELAPRGFQGRVNGGFLNVARVVDLALNNGVDRLTNEQIGPQTGAPEDLKDFDDVLTAVRTQTAYFVKHQVINAAVVDMVQREHTPHLFLSSLVEGCIENGKDMTQGGSLWGGTPILHVGEATAADSLIGVKKAVFDDQLISMKELKEILDSNFAGAQGEKIYQALLAMPKYGNDDDYADEVMQKMINIFFDEIEKHKDIDGRFYTSTILTLGATVPHGWTTGATANGRKATMPVADSMSASNGADKEGPTAMLLSASKIDQTRTIEGNVVNLKFTKMALEEKKNLQQLVNLVSVYFDDLKGQEIQVNVVDESTLKDAQEYPEKHQDLIIRVAGYSARFTELAKELQDDIIRRTEYNTL
ncbi:pyruvate formate-lyase [Alkaliphilus metalliredigens QYMF]|uniref:Pyruvate formate-lyase n=1 Tax=Alkaliphilus metalliredigens (strain QYMF) TaxID=293826 RepID=A6TKL5_ALKMQ|nr:formate C-acetyltransferase/glycerol dehydratase family glycyl radical enzyme [Alkaliphilus metalliredigens]ABR46733.1 pyruvate formate-lyase [Alkaliphilus metalliredigens QYMF]